MQKDISLKLLPSEAASNDSILLAIAAATGKKKTDITGYYILKHSLDARGRQATINIQLRAFIGEPFRARELIQFDFRNIRKSPRRVGIIGAGPAGLFAALRLIENGIQPIIFERGKEVKNRRRDLALLNKNGQLNKDSNYCFGEGGAGTYSDGKLYTRSNKRGDIQRILNLFVHFGASENILFESHPHIGTNKLPQIISSLTQTIQECGGEVLFGKKVIDIQVKNDHVSGIITEDTELHKIDAVILATGHSARDIFFLLHNKKIKIEAKPFALGVRVEHPQSLIDQIQYHLPAASTRSITADIKTRHLPPASYNLVHQGNGKNVFSFCMCPGGIIAPASTNNGELVVNGWSPSKRNNPFANSGIVVPVEKEDLHQFNKFDELAGIYFQKAVEEKAFAAGGGNFVAPAQRLIDFTNNKLSSSLPACSYHPGLNSTSLQEVLPSFIFKALREGFAEFGKKMRDRQGHGYFTNEAVVVATESRTSSPVRIPRDPEGLNHPQINNLYPCGEGAGYAGGIMSAAMDGERIASAIAQKWSIGL